MKNIYPAYVSKHTPHREKQVILLKISNKVKQWQNLATKKLSALLRGLISKLHDDFYCLSCLHSFATEEDFCNVIMPSEDTKILDFNKYQIFDKYHLLFMEIFNL